MPDKKFYGIMGNAAKFIEALTLIESIDYDWTQKYVDPKTGKQWLKYMIDRDTGRYYNLMLLTPKATTDEMIDIVFNSPDHDEVEGAAHRLFIEELDEKKAFRPKLMERLKAIDISGLDTTEKKRIKTIILNAGLIDKTNKHEIIGKHFSEIQKDVDFFKEMAEYAKQVLTKLG